MVVFLFKKFLKFVCFWLHWALVAAHRLSLVAVSGSYCLAVARGLSCSVACGIFLIQGTHVACIGRWILNHWTTRKVQHKC